MITNNEVALKILQVGKAGFDTQEDGYKKLDDCIKLIDEHVSEQLIISSVGKQFELLIDFYESTCNKTVNREYAENVVKQYLQEQNEIS